METIRQFAMVFCSAAVICGAVSFLLPKDFSGRAGNIVISLFFLCSLIEPIKNISQNFENNLPEIEFESEELAKEIELNSQNLAFDLAENHINEVCKEIMRKNEIEFNDIEVKIEEKNLTFILKLPHKYQNREQEIRNLIKETYAEGFVEIIWEEI